MRAVSSEESAVRKSVAGQKIRALFAGDRISGSFQNLKHVLPDLPLFRQSLILKQVGWMIRRHERDASVVLPRTPELGDGGSAFAQQSLGGASAQSDQDLWLNQVDLSIEPGKA